MWQTRVAGTKSLPALQACDILQNHLPDIASYIMIDSIAGSGSPMLIFKASLDAWLAAYQEQPVFALFSLER
jgi:hypothetical protein